jgi:hypothetical protein
MLLWSSSTDNSLYRYACLEALRQRTCLACHPAGVPPEKQKNAKKPG